MVTSVDPANKEELILENLQVTIHDLSTAMELPMWTVQDYVHDELGNWGVWMLGTNTSDTKAQKPMFWSYFCRYSVVREKRNELLDSTMAGHFTPQIKQVGMQWKNQIFWKPKNSKVCQSVGILYLYSRMHKKLATLNSRLWGTTVNGIGLLWHVRTTNRHYSQEQTWMSVATCDPFAQ
jgi:hypothetical protein